MDFTGKVVLITGAGSGIGEAVALNFAKLSANLSLIDINQDYINNVAEKCEKMYKTKVLTAAIDVLKDDELKKAVDMTREEFGRIDVLVNCAGIWKLCQIADSNVLENFDAVMNVNLRAGLAAAHYAVPALIETKGCIIYMGSVMSMMVGNSIGYNVSKAGLVHLTKCLAAELAEFDVRVNCIAPGPVQSKILIHSGLSINESDEVMTKLINNVPLKSELKREDVANVAAFLASEHGLRITGTEIVVDGGFSINSIKCF